MSIIHGTVQGAARTSVPLRRCLSGAILTHWWSSSRGAQPNWTNEYCVMLSLCAVWGVTAVHSYPSHFYLTVRS